MIARALVFLGVGALLCASSAWAAPQEKQHPRYNQQTISTDRPGAAISSNTVGRIVVQLETSFGIHLDDETGVTKRSFTFPSLLRLGILRWLELRVEGELVALANDGVKEADEVGVTDLSFGIKLQALKNQGVIPSMGILAQVLAPIGDDGFSAGGLEPTLKLAFDWSLPARFSLTFNMGLDLPVRDALGHKFVRYLSVINVGHALPFWSQRITVFVETETRFPLRKGKKAQVSIDLGFSLRVFDNLQLDVQSLFGLTRSSEDIQLGFGISWRI